jgi:DNA helicase-2/ATP-dependent DNA helicase PcrA
LLDESKTQLFLGPPGTGKTTTLLGVVETELNNGVDPGKIGFVSFTKKATTEATERAVARFGIHERELPYFRTLHSLSFAGLGVRRGQVLQREHYRTFGDKLGEVITGAGPGEDGLFGVRATRGDVMLHIDSLARTRQISLYSQWRATAPDDVEWPALERFSRSLRQFKHDMNLLDFTDMLERFPTQGFVPQLDALIIDEAQDLSKLQWTVVEKLAERAQRIYVGGDDDQAIYRWAGADVERFLSLRGLKHPLTKSYRLSRAVHARAHEIVKRIKHRFDKPFDPRDEEGSVSYHNDADEVDMSEGSWLVLARNGYQLNAVEERVRQRGWLYESKTFHAEASDAVHAMLDWERLRRGRRVTLDRVRVVYKFMSSGRGVARIHRDLLNVDDSEEVSLDDLQQRYGLLTTAIWHEALDRIPADDRQYYVAVLKSGEKLTERPRIKLSTIHAAKGGEADNVLLLSDMSRRTWEDWQRFPDDEHRVFYVGATRAKHNLRIVAAHDALGYDV